jgi:hypothetical protein
MPISLLIQHALSAKNIGAEILQFELYWYFFDNGQAKENLKLLEIMPGLVLAVVIVTPPLQVRVK